MRAKIQKSMLFVIGVTLLLAFLILSTVFYWETLKNLKEEVKQETSYIQKALQLVGIQYLEEIDDVQENTRLTLVQENGEVLYDSEEEVYQLENHAEREEIKAAFTDGSGEAFRTSETVGKITYYYAVQMDEESVLRVSKTIDHIIPTMISTFSYMVIIAVVMFAFAAFLARRQTKKLILPLYELDLSDPLSNDVYEELHPLLVSIDQQNREKKQVENMRKEFSANVSHELKTPLTSISGYAEIMKSGMVKEADMIVFSDRIYKEASRLIALIGDVIKISKLDEESVELEKEWVDLFALSREICSRLSLTADRKHVRVEVTGESVQYFGVRQILNEMIYNLCENAIKYNVDGGSVKVWVGNTLKGAKVVVEDTGIGIPKDQQTRIFERFYRVDKSHSKETGGTGLGLSIVKHGAIYHRATIQVKSELGHGTRMEVLFEKQPQSMADGIVMKTREE